MPVSRPINGQDACKPGKPALLPVEKLKLHYVVHYMLRGTWSDVVPEEEDEQHHAPVADGLEHPDPLPTRVVDITAELIVG